MAPGHSGWKIHGKNAINLLVGDGLYTPFMVIFWMVNCWVLYGFVGFTTLLLNGKVNCFCLL